MKKRLLALSSMDGAVITGWRCQHWTEVSALDGGVITGLRCHHWTEVSSLDGTVITGLRCYHWTEVSSLDGGVCTHLIPASPYTVICVRAVGCHPSSIQFFVHLI